MTNHSDFIASRTRYIGAGKACLAPTIPKWSVGTAFLPSNTKTGGHDVVKQFLGTMSPTHTVWAYIVSMSPYETIAESIDI